MTAKSLSLEASLELFRSRAASYQDVELAEGQILEIFARVVGGPEAAKRLWERVSQQLRKPRVSHGYVFHWNMFKSVMSISRLPTAEQLERISEYYRESAPRDVKSYLRSLTGRQFEILVVTLLTKLSKFRNVLITQLSNDGGVDFRGWYVPEANGPEWPLVGQAKHLSRSVSASAARDFIGALDTCGEKAPVGLFISISGFSQPAVRAFDASHYRIVRWSLDELTSRLLEAGLGVRTFAPDVRIVDQTFWEELRGRP